MVSEILHSFNSGLLPETGPPLKDKGLEISNKAQLGYGVETGFCRDKLLSVSLLSTSPLQRDQISVRRNTQEMLRN